MTLTIKGENMQCVTPMFREYIEYTPEQKRQLKEEGRKQYNKIIPRAEVAKQLIYEPNSLRSLNEINESLKASGSPFRWQTIPCKNCWACKLNYSAEWATRITCECKKSEHNYFVTLTYDEDHLPIADNIKIGDKIYENDGTIEWCEGTVWEPHMHKFIHDLRQYLDRKYGSQYDENGIRINKMQYYYAAEYGETTHRPHYHIILMNCPLDLSQFREFHIDERKKLHWKTKELEKFWTHGMIDVAEVEWSCAAYVARYCMKKLHDHSKSDEDYAKEGKLKEFVRMSRNIGRSYYEQNKEQIYSYDELIMKTVKGNTGSMKPPKAWDRLFEKEHPEAMDLIKQSRKEAAERSAELKRTLTDYTDLKMLEMAEVKFNKIAKQLPRIGEWD